MKTAKKIFQPAFGCALHMKAGNNTQHNFWIMDIIQLETRHLNNGSSENQAPRYQLFEWFRCLKSHCIFLMRASSLRPCKANISQSLQAIQNLLMFSNDVRWHWRDVVLILGTKGWQRHATLVTWLSPAMTVPATQKYLDAEANPPRRQCHELYSKRKLKFCSTSCTF